MGEGQEGDVSAGNNEMREGRTRNLHLRARILQGIRAFFSHRGYLEVETPHRIPANAPEAHIDAVESDGWWLQTSPELAMKRLVAAGHERIFQLCRCWRRAERGRLHLPEFTLLEWYRAGSDYLHLMDECEALLVALAADLGLGGTLIREGRGVVLTPPWPRLTVKDAFGRFARADVDRAVADGSFDLLLVEKVEPALAAMGIPVFLVDYPIEMAALARAKPGRPDRAERFELYAGGLELANAFSELVDPVEQRRRFEVEEAARRSGGKAPCRSPEPFLADLDRLPPTAGIALGVDRLVMLFAGARTIDEVVSFVPEAL